MGVVCGRHVREHEGLGARLLGNRADLLGGGVREKQVLDEALFLGTVGRFAEEGFDPCGVDDLVDEDVGVGASLTRFVVGAVSPEKVIDPSSVSNRKP